MIVKILFSFVFGILAMAALVDRKRKKNNNYPHIPTNPNVKPGDSENYKMGDHNHHINGGF
ncbi:MAG: hypothetical protein IMZ40_00120 [Bacilli bacterium]|nr:hypothetical protein [Bacilli bacterium]